MLVYFISGIVAGVSASSYLIGKELYSSYRKNSLQEKQLVRMRKLNHQLSTKMTLNKENSNNYVFEKSDLLAH
jgi:hypothetical protein